MNGIHVRLVFSEDYLKKDIPLETLEKGKAILKFQFDKEKIYDLINSALPETIKVFCKFKYFYFLAYKVVTKSFNIKSRICSRIYEYIIPAKMFYKYCAASDSYPIPNDLNLEELTQKIHSLVQKYKGTHNFHNYSKGAKATDKSSCRYILDMKAELLDKAEMEQILGSSLENEYIKITLLG